MAYQPSHHKSEKYATLDAELAKKLVEYEKGRLAAMQGTIVLDMSVHKWHVYKSASVLLLDKGKAMFIAAFSKKECAEDTINELKWYDDGSYFIRLWNARHNCYGEQIYR